jgi:SUMO ligase MMS21 Smc5/6 complex component
MIEADADNSPERRHLAAAVVENACGRAIAVCLDMTQAAQVVGVDEQLGDVREALMRLQAAAKAARSEAERKLGGE